MNNRHPWQLKKSKSWGPFWSYQLNSTANLANLAKFWGKWAGCRIFILSEIRCYLRPHIFGDNNYNSVVLAIVYVLLILFPWFVFSSLKTWTFSVNFCNPYLDCSLCYFSFLKANWRSRKNGTRSYNWARKGSIRKFWTGSCYWTR